MPGFVFWSLMMSGFPWCLGVVAPKLLRSRVLSSLVEPAPHVADEKGSDLAEKFLARHFSIAVIWSISRSALVPGGIQRRNLIS